jgi:RNA polymerase sigma-70 factor (ECF subfamily)
LDSDRRTYILEDLHQRHAGAIHRKCMAMLWDRGEAEDAVQETFLRAHQLLCDGRDAGAGKRLPWLLAIARHVCLHMLRTRRRKGMLLVGEAEVEDTALHGRLLARSYLEWLAGSLDDRDKRILASTFVDGMTQAEAARALGVSRRAVVKRLTSLRARYSPWAPHRRQDAGPWSHAAGDPNDRSARERASGCSRTLADADSAPSQSQTTVGARQVSLA